MKKAMWLLVLLFIYICTYKIYLIFLGEIFIYILNPLIWIPLTIICHFTLHNKRRIILKNYDVWPLVTILSILYVICYYAFGLISGYTNNPYSTSLSGIVVNIFSIWLVIGLKEYLRYLFIHTKSRKYKNLYLIAVFFVFFISDINILHISISINILDLLSKELIIPLIINLLMTYLAYNTDYKSPIIYQTILLLPSIFFRVVPDYEWLVIMVFNVIFCIVTYLSVQYIVERQEKNLPLKLINLINPKRWLPLSLIIFLIIFFGAGFFTFKPIVILTGSMAPIISPGDLTIIKESNVNDIKIGDIIEYKLDDIVVVHRVIVIKYDYGATNFVTKGDANKNADPKPVTESQVLGKMVYNIPYLGYPAYLLENIVNNNKEVNIEQGGETNAP